MNKKVLAFLGAFSLLSLNAGIKDAVLNKVGGVVNKAIVTNATTFLTETPARRIACILAGYAVARHAGNKFINKLSVSETTACKLQVATEATCGLAALGLIIYQLARA